MTFKVGMKGFDRNYGIPLRIIGLKETEHVVTWGPIPSGFSWTVNVEIGYLEEIWVPDLVAEIVELFEL